jgi:hypothetical protein
LLGVSLPVLALMVALGHGEHFYAGLPTSFWRQQLLEWHDKPRLKSWPLEEWADTLVKLWTFRGGKPAVLSGDPAATAVLLDLLAPAESESVRWEASHAMSAHFSKAYWNPAELRIFMITRGGTVAKFQDGVNIYMVVDLVGDELSPMGDAKYLLLFDHRGNLLDQLVCSVRLRVIPMHSFRRLSTNIRTVDDSPQVVIHYSQWEKDDSNLRDYAIAHDEVRHKFPWGGVVREDDGWRGWGRDLCRIAIVGRKFKVLFPEVEKGTLEPLRPEAGAEAD